MSKNTQKAGNKPVTMDRRRSERRSEEVSVTPEPRRKQPRRRHIDPTTCERDYNEEEIAFMHAMDEYKRASGRMFPTCSEVLEVVRNLGYVRLSADQQQLLSGKTISSENPV